jgi:hypothetical protein
MSVALAIIGILMVVAWLVFVFFSGISDGPIDRLVYRKKDQYTGTYTYKIVELSEWCLETHTESDEWELCDYWVRGIGNDY